MTVSYLQSKRERQKTEKEGEDSFAGTNGGLHGMKKSVLGPQEAAVSNAGNAMAFGPRGKLENRSDEYICVSIVVIVQHQHRLAPVDVSVVCWKSLLQKSMSLVLRLLY